MSWADGGRRIEAGGGGVEMSNDWVPTKEQKEYLLLVLSMTMDCYQGKGTDTVQGYLQNLKDIIELFPREKIEKI